MLANTRRTDEARLAPEPVFSVSKDLDFQNFHSVFRSGLVEPALSNAVMLSLALAASGGVINKECLIYRGQAIHHIRETMALNNKSVSESTIGAILLLVGVEVRDSNLRVTCGVAYVNLPGQTRDGITSRHAHGSCTASTHNMPDFRYPSN